MTQKPREKIQELGPSALEDHELLAIILSKGSKAESVFDLSKRLTKGFYKDEFLQGQKIAQMRQDLKIGYVHACQLMAVLELGKRYFADDQSRKRVNSVAEAYEIVKNMQYLQKEHLRGLYLNTRKKVIHDEIITIGSLDSNIIHPREIFRPAVEYGAYAVILAHNHPSGDNAPSKSDLEVTQKLFKIGELLQIPLIDHLVIGHNSYTSIAQSLNT